VAGKLRHFLVPKNSNRTQWVQSSSKSPKKHFSIVFFNSSNIFLTKSTMLVDGARTSVLSLHHESCTFRSKSNFSSVFSISSNKPTIMVDGARTSVLSIMRAAHTANDIIFAQVSTHCSIVTSKLKSHNCSSKTGSDFHTIKNVTCFLTAALLLLFLRKLLAAKVLLFKEKQRKTNHNSSRS
jgi:hypothetical protein